MNELTMQQLDEKLGRFGFFSQLAASSLIGKVGYVSGIPPFDMRLNEKASGKKKTTNYVFFQMRPKGLEIGLNVGLKNYFIGLSPNQINYFVFEKPQEVIGQESKSIVARALLGGVLLGPVGAIVGGMTGIGNKDVKTELFPDNILCISVTGDNEEGELLFSINNYHLKDVVDFVRHNFSDKIRTAREIESLQEKKNVTLSSSASVADEITKLRQLLDAGTLTVDEFNAQKRKLLEFSGR